MRRSYSYEVTVEIQGKTQIDGTFENEADARARATYLLSLARFTAVRVIRIDSRGTPTVIFEKAYAGGGKTVSVGSLDEAPPCADVYDLYRYPARRTLLRVMRRWCDEQSLVPLEVLHRPLLLRQIEREDLLFAQAVSRIATVQARDSRSAVEERADALRVLFREALERAKQAAALEPWPQHLRAHGLASLLDHARATLPEGEAVRAATYALAQWLEVARDWPDKLGALCSLLDGTGAPPDPAASDPAAPDPAAIAFLDEAIAETLDGPQPIRAVLGYAPDLARAVASLAHLAQGTLDDRHCHTPALDRLNAAIARWELPVTRGVLLNRIARALDGASPLTRQGRAFDARAYEEMLPLLLETGGFKGGGPMCVAATRRAQTAFGHENEDLPVDGAVARIIDSLPDPGTRIGYLLDLLAMEFGRRRATMLTARLAGILARMSSLRDFFAGNPQAWTAESIRERFRRRLLAGGIRGDIADLFMLRLEHLALHPEAVPPDAGTQRSPDIPDSPAAREQTATLEPSDVQTVCLQLQVLAEPRAVKGPHMVLYYRGREFVCTRDTTEFVLGRGADCDLTVGARTASRRHATVRSRQGEFLLLDRSRNGTYVRLGVQKPMVVKNSSVSLAGMGTLYLGADPDGPDGDKQHLILFQQFTGK